MSCTWTRLAAAWNKPAAADCPATDARPRGVEMTLHVDDQDAELTRLLLHIKKTAAIGHSFSVVVDPGDPDHEAKFGIDGDGVFRIFDIKIGGKSVEEK